MRKIGLTAVAVLLLGCLFSMSVSADGTMLRVRFSGQLAGNHHMDLAGSTTDYAVDTGFSIGTEGLFSVLPYLQLGVGLEYEFGRKLTDFTGNFQFMPIYGVVRVPFEVGPVTPYAVARIGYGLFMGDTNYSGGADLGGGLYYAVGGGIDLRFSGFSIFAEGTYSADNGSYSLSGVTIDVRYTRLDLSAGVSIPL